MPFLQLNGWKDYACSKEQMAVGSFNVALIETKFLKYVVVSKS